MYYDIFCFNQNIHAPCCIPSSLVKNDYAESAFCLKSAVCKCSTVWTPGYTAELALEKQILAALGFWPVSVEVTSCLSSNTSTDMYFLLESPLLSPELGTTSFSLLSQHACSARENSRRDEKCSECNRYPLPRWKHRMCRGKWKAQKVTNWTKEY